MSDAAPPRLPPAFRLITLDEVDSTNDEARQLLRAGAAEGTLVWAQAQRGGRGRDGRNWASPRGNLYASLILRPEGPPGDVAQLGFVAALAIGSALGAFVPPLVALTLKWPNDVLLDARKIAGILLESEGARADGVDGVIIGFGINIASHPGETRIPATSIAALEGEDVEPARVLEAIARQLQSWTRRWTEEGFSPIRGAWLAFAHGLGRPIGVRLARETVEGVFAGIDERGMLELDTATGRRLVSAGDVFFPKPL
ncbi:MAG: biotin--[acetyl-CoA-carboxylase] ligase [Alphaproteobacteria bacterium]|nr:biotin--[acetyl-CoA-carboxylase] ligase [Alphaproteobacteria bacterium]